MSTLKFNQWLNPDNTENYKCRAWVNFNGTGTVAIRAAGNVSSITDISTGVYRVNFTMPLPDANYAAALSAGGAVSAITSFPSETVARTVNDFTMGTGNTVFASLDSPVISAMFFR